MITPQNVYNKLSPEGKMEVLKLETHFARIEDDLKEINELLEGIEKDLGIK